jgi:hypothetical protein
MKVLIFFSFLAASVLVNAAPPSGVAWRGCELRQPVTLSLTGVPAYTLADNTEDAATVEVSGVGLSDMRFVYLAVDNRLISTVLFDDQSQFASLRAASGCPEGSQASDELTARLRRQERELTQDIGTHQLTQCARDFAEQCSLQPGVYDICVPASPIILEANSTEYVALSCSYFRPFSGGPQEAEPTADHQDVRYFADRTAACALKATHTSGSTEQGTLRSIPGRGAMTIIRNSNKQFFCQYMNVGASQ